MRRFGSLIGILSLVAAACGVGVSDSSLPVDDQTERFAFAEDVDAGSGLAVQNVEPALSTTVAASGATATEAQPAQVAPVEPADARPTAPAKASIAATDLPEGFFFSGENLIEPPKVEIGPDGRPTTVERDPAETSTDAFHEIQWHDSDVYGSPDRTAVVVVTSTVLEGPDFDLHDVLFQPGDEPDDLEPVSINGAEGYMNGRDGFVRIDWKPRPYIYRILLMEGAKATVTTALELAENVTDSEVAP